MNVILSEREKMANQLEFKDAEYSNAKVELATLHKALDEMNQNLIKLCLHIGKAGSVGWMNLKL